MYFFHRYELFSAPFSPWGLYYIHLCSQIWTVQCTFQPLRVILYTFVFTDMSCSVHLLAPEGYIIYICVHRYELCSAPFSPWGLYYIHLCSQIWAVQCTFQPLRVILYTFVFTDMNCSVHLLAPEGYIIYICVHRYELFRAPFSPWGLLFHHTCPACGDVHSSHGDLRPWLPQDAGSQQPWVQTTALVTKGLHQILDKYNTLITWA